MQCLIDILEIEMNSFPNMESSAVTEVDYIFSQIFVFWPPFFFVVPLFKDMRVFSWLVVHKGLLTNSYHFKSRYPGSWHRCSVEILKISIKVSYILSPIDVVFDWMLLITKSREFRGERYTDIL